MEVLLVSHRYLRESKGGTEVLVQDVAESLAERGHNVSILAASDSVDPCRNSAPYDRGNVREVPVRPSFSEEYPANWERDEGRVADEARGALCSSRAYDVVHMFHFARVGFRLLDISALAGVPFFITLTDYSFICPDHQLFKRKTRSICRPMVPTPDCCACVDGAPDERTIEAWRRRNVDVLTTRALGIYLQTPEQARIVREAGVPHGRIRCDVASYRIPAHWVTRAANERREGAFRFGVVSRLSSEKGLDVALAAFEQVGRLLPCTLDIYGDADPDEANLEQFLTAARQCKGVRLRGAVPFDELDRALLSLDCLLVPSLWLENHPMVLTYARALGIPVIASSVASLLHLADDPGIYFAEPDDPDSWATSMESISKVLTVPNRRREADQAWTRYVDSLERTYRGAAKCLQPQ